MLVIKLAPHETKLQLADRSLIYPKGILRDMLVGIGRSVVPCDFLIVDIPEDRTTPIILGRPCLATCGTIVDVTRGKIVMEIGDVKHKFSIDRSPDFCTSAQSVFSVDTPTKSCCEKEKFTNLSYGDIGLLTLPNDEKVKVEGIGEVMIETHRGVKRRLGDVRYEPRPQK